MKQCPASRLVFSLREALALAHCALVNGVHINQWSLDTCLPSIALGRRLSKHSDKPSLTACGGSPTARSIKPTDKNVGINVWVIVMNEYEQPQLEAQKGPVALTFGEHRALIIIDADNASTRSR